MADTILFDRESDIKETRRGTCKGCGINRDEGRWYKGVTTHCAECWKAKQKRYYRETIDDRKEYERSRAMLPHRVALRERYQATPEGKAAVARAHKASHDRLPNHRRARGTVNNAIRDGRLVKPTHCERCGAECSAKRSLHAHHADYAKPLDVEWLCGTCHRLEHRPPCDPAKKVA